MIIEETFVIHAPRQKAWDFFLDINRMSRCLPGAEVKQIDADNFEGTLTVKVGPLGASFSGSVAITKQTPPTALGAAIKAKDKTTGSMVQGTFAATLEAQGDSQTEVHYVIDVAIRGKLGQFGQSVIQDTARRISAEFLKCVKAQMEAPEGEAAPPPMSSGQAGSLATRAFLAALMKTITDWIKRLLGRSQPEEQRRA